MLLAALESEVASYVESHQELVDESAHRMVVRNGKAGERTLMTGAGALRIRAPRIDDHREGYRFSSSGRDTGSPHPGGIPVLLVDPAPLPRRSPKVGDMLPVLYLRGCRRGTSLWRLKSFSGPRPGCRR